MCPYTYLPSLQNSMIVRQLAQHADIPRRVAEEANRILGTRPPSVEALRTMSYTFAVVKEALRCVQAQCRHLLDNIHPVCLRSETANHTAELEAVVRDLFSIWRVQLRRLIPHALQLLADRRV